MTNLKLKNKFNSIFKITKQFFLFLTLFLIVLIFVFLTWLNKNFTNFNLNEILFHTLNFKKIEKNLYFLFLKNIIAPSVFITVVFWFFNKKIYNNILKDKNLILNIKKFNIKNNFKLLERKKDYVFLFKIKTKQITISIKRKTILFFLIDCYLIFFISTIFNLNKNLIKPLLEKSLSTPQKVSNNVYNFFEENYVNPQHVKLTFPKKKRNLIYIFVESLESTFFSKNLGGMEKQNLLEPITDLTTQGINFSNTEKFGGAQPIFGTNFTTAGITAQTLAIPLKIESDIIHKQKLNKNFLKNCYGLGNILKKEGYFQMFLIGSDKQFGNRDSLMKNHGNYEIFDYFKAIEEKYILKNYKKWWGFEDEKLFKIAKEKLKKLENKKQPFNLTILTTNTHFPDGFVEENRKKKFKEKYSNAIYYSCVEIKNFVEWLKKQKFYKNTTVIISGDHLSMNTTHFKKMDKSFKRTIYNVFLNSKTKPSKTKNRNFTTLDMLPSTLSSLGVKIKKNKLGLGVNLFSKEKTLAEKYGISHLNNELKKHSKLYEKLLF